MTGYEYEWIDFSAHVSQRDPRDHIAREVLKALCTESGLDLPIDTVYRKTGLNSNEIDEVLERIAALGMVDLNEGWVRLSRNAVFAALCAELKIVP